MQTTDQHKKSWQTGLLNRLGLTNEPTVRVYHGYGHDDQLMIHGHVFRLAPLPRTKYRKSVIRNMVALLRLFIVKPYADVQVRMEWDGELYEATTDKDGFFKFEWKDRPPLPKGWHQVPVQALVNGQVIAAATQVSLYCVGGSFSDFSGVEVNTRHTRLCSEGNEGRFMRRQFAPA